MDASAYFNGKKITVMGLGLLGRGIGDIRYLASTGAELIVTDPKSAEILAPSVEALSDIPGITFVLGEHRLEDFRGRDLILKAAGVPLDSVYLAEARKEGTPIRMSADLFAELSGVPVIGITGTRGKSTVTHMLDAIFVKAGKKVLLGGNVRGVSTLALIPDATPEHMAILELDSWQLQGFGEASMSPHISVFTTFFPDHLNYYHNDLDAYLADKANIFLFQKENDTLVLGDQVAPTVIDTYGEHIDSKIVIAGLQTFPKEWELIVPGEHNRYDAALALAAARAAGIDDEISRTALESYPGIPGRLELVGMKNGVTFYNDTNSTTPEATIAALHALVNEEEKEVVLIMGGSDKGLDMENLLALIPDTTKHVSLLAGTGTDRLKEKLPDAPIVNSLREAVEDAIAHTSLGDIILFSPAFASFGMFKNEYDRGDQFVTLVNSYGND